MSKYNVEAEGISIEAIFNKHGGTDGVRRFMRDELVLVDADPPVFPTWKTITLGPMRSEEYRKALLEGGFRIKDQGDNILRRLPAPTFDVDTPVDLVAPSNADLGFESGACRRDTYLRGFGLGLWLCPPEAGPALRHQYPDQPLGEELNIAMEPIADSAGYSRVFRVVVTNDLGRWLDTRNGLPDYIWGGDRRWVFVHPQGALKSRALGS